MVLVVDALLVVVEVVDAACGIINVTAGGGVGGQAGVGHNGNGGGTGGRRGISAYRTTYWSGGVSESADGALPTEAGYVKIQFSNVTTYYDKLVVVEDKVVIVLYHSQE